MVIDAGQKSARPSNWLQQRGKIDHSYRTVEVADKSAPCIWEKSSKIAADLAPVIDRHGKGIFGAGTGRNLEGGNEISPPPQKTMR